MYSYFLCYSLLGRLPHGTCYNVSVNTSAVISTDSYTPLLGQTIFRETGSRYHCWDVAVPAGLKVKATCEYNLTEPSNFIIFLVDDHFDRISGRFSSNPLPDIIVSTGHILDILLLSERYGTGHYEGISMECNLTSVEGT